MNTWQPIEIAPKGGGAERTDDPKWVNPPRLLLAFPDGTIEIGYWDQYYALGGYGYEQGRSAWVTQDGPTWDSNAPTHWMPLPALPNA